MRTRQSIRKWRCAALADTARVYGDAEVYRAEFDDAVEDAVFARYNRIASCMADMLMGHSAGSAAACVQEAVHWQIWFMRGRSGGAQACFDGLPAKESFAGYSIERRADRDGTHLMLAGMEICPMMVSVLRQGGMLSCWV